MVNVARTIVRAAKFDHPISEAVQRSRLDMYLAGLGAGNVNKYVAFDSNKDPFILVVAQQRDIGVLTPPGYNLTFSVTSYSDGQNRTISDEFSTDTGVDFNIEPPQGLVSLISKTDLLLPLLESKPRLLTEAWELRKIK